MADPSSILQSPLVPIYLVDDGTNQGVPCRVSTRPREQSVSSYRKQPMATIGGILRVGSLTVGLTTAKIEREDSIQLDRPGRSGHGAVGYLQVQRKGYDWALVILQHGLGTPVRVPDETGRIEETGPIINNIAEPHRISKIAQGKETVEIITSFGGLKPLIRGKGSEYNSVATPSELASQSSSTELESSLTVIADIRPSDIGSWVISCTQPQELIGMVIGSYRREGRNLHSEVVVRPMHQIMSEMNSEYMGGVSLPSPAPTPEQWKEPKVNYVINIKKHSGSSSKWWFAEKYGRDRGFNRTDCQPEQKPGFQLEGEEAKVWEHEIRPLIIAIIRKTSPMLRSEPLPIVKLYGLSVDASGERRPRTVIVCASTDYSQQIQRAIRQEHILDRSGFELIMADKVVRCKPEDDRGSREGSSALGSRRSAADMV